jgi:uncharacterized protein YdeI (YjbR/CyaY-like superfamily)
MPQKAHETCVQRFSSTIICPTFVRMADAPNNSTHPKTRAQWRAWLAKHHTRTEGVWLISYKKATGKPRVEYDDIVEEALCWGWVDSKVNALDEERSMLWITPRKPKTGWSKPNKERVAKMISARLMQPAGLAKIEAAKQDGTWSKLDGVEELEIPPDLQRAFKQYKGSAANWEAFPRSVKRGILEWILQAKRAETREKRVEETARLAAENKRANQWRA